MHSAPLPPPSVVAAQAKSVAAAGLLAPVAATVPVFTTALQLASKPAATATDTDAEAPTVAATKTTRAQSTRPSNPPLAAPSRHAPPAQQGDGAVGRNAIAFHPLPDAGPLAPLPPATDDLPPLAAVTAVPQTDPATSFSSEPAKTDQPAPNAGRPLRPNSVAAHTPQPADVATPAGAARPANVSFATAPPARAAVADVPAPSAPATLTIAVPTAVAPTAAHPPSDTKLPASPMDQIAATIRVATVGPAQHVTVTLSPRELGTVEIHVARQGSSPVTVAIAVERAETLSLLRRDAPALQSALDRVGVPVTPQHVTMVLAASDSPALGTATQGDSRPPSQRPEPPRAAATLPADAAPDDPPDRAPISSRAGIDITA